MRAIVGYRAKHNPLEPGHVSTSDDQHGCVNAITNFDNCSVHACTSSGSSDDCYLLEQKQYAPASSISSFSNTTYLVSCELLFHHFLRFLQQSLRMGFRLIRVVGLVNLRLARAWCSGAFYITSLELGSTTPAAASTTSAHSGSWVTPTLRRTKRSPSRTTLSKANYPSQVRGLAKTCIGKKHEPSRHGRK